jgi:hypothetical protein
MVEDYWKIAETLMKKNIIQILGATKKEEYWQIKGNLPVKFN